MIVHVNVALAVSTPSPTLTVAANVPLAVGVPEMMPLAASIARPGGRPVADQVSRSPSASVAVTDCTTGCPCGSERAAGATSTGGWFEPPVSRTVDSAAPVGKTPLVASVHAVPFGLV